MARFETVNAARIGMLMEGRRFLLQGRGSVAASRCTGGAVAGCGPALPGGCYWADLRDALLEGTAAELLSDAVLWLFSSRSIKRERATSLPKVSK